MKRKVTLKIPHELYVKLKAMIEGTGFSSVNEFVTFTMRLIAKGGRLDGRSRLRPSDIEKVKQRLKELGYIA